MSSFKLNLHKGPFPTTVHTESMSGKQNDDSFLNATKHCFVFPDSSDGKESTCNVGDPGSILG